MKKFMRYCVMLPAFLSVFTKCYSQTSWKGITSTNWAITTNWTAGVPLAVTDVIIGDANFTGVFQPAISATASAKSLTIGGTVLSQLTVTSVLTVTGDININSNGTLVNGIASIAVNGALTNNGTVTSSGTLNFTPTSAVTLQLEGTHFSSTGKVIFGGSGAITISGSPSALQDVVIANTNAAGITPGSTWNMSGDFSINSNAIFNAGTYSHSVGGNIESDGILNGNTSTFAMSSSTGQLTGSPGTLFNNLIILGTVTSNSDFSVAGDFINDGTYDGSIGRLIMTGSAAAVIGGTTTPSSIALLTIDKAVGAVVTSNVNINNITDLMINSGTLFTSTYSIAQNPAGGVIIIAADGTLKLGGTNTIPAFSGYGFDTQSTVEYAGTTQTIANGPVYGNLTISAAGNKTSFSFLPLNIAGNFTISAGNFVANNNTYSIGGNWIMSGGTFNNTNSVIQFNGSNDQFIQTIAPFNSININKTNGMVILNSDITVNAILSFTAKKIQTGIYTVISPFTGTVTGAAQSTGWVEGNLQKSATTGTSVSRTFEVGDANYYTPATVLFASVTTAGNLMANVTASDHVEIDYSGIDSSTSVNRYWSLTNSGIVFTTAATTFNWNAADPDAGTTTANFKVAAYNSGNWTMTTVASPLSTSIQATGLTDFGDFAIGENISQYRWTGEAFTANWGTAKNWSGGVPTTTFNVLIPNGVTGGRIYPSLTSGSGTVNNLTIQSSAGLTVSGGTLQISGTVTNSGILNVADGTIEFNGSSAQSITAGMFSANIIKNLMISNNVNLWDVDTLTGTLTVAAGKTFTTNDNLILRSDANRTARISALPVDGSGNATAFITGLVHIERYIPMRKAWRLLSTPVRSATSPTINNAWQEGVSSAFVNNPNPGYGVFIQGGSAINGFDQGLTSNATIKVFNNATGNFVALPASPGTHRPITDYPGYFVYIRGDRSIDLMEGNSAAITPTTLRMQGEINAGKLITTVNATGYTILGNPYPSAIDFETLTRSNVKNSFYVWDPKLAGTYGLGGFVTFSWNSGTGTYDATTAASPVSKYIPSGEAIIIESADGINPGSISVKETDKTANGSDAVFGRPGGLNQQLRVNMYSVNADGSTALLDGVLTTYDDNNSNSIDNNDAKKLNGSGENIGIKRETKMFAIERRRTITASDTTFLNISQMKIQVYQLEITAVDLDQPGIIAVLKDSYAGSNNEKLLNTNGTSMVSFNITADPASYAANRFSIVFRTSIVLPVTIKTIKAYRQQKDIAVEWTTDNEINITHYEVERSADGRNFTKINSTTVTATNGGNAAYKFIDTKPFDGNNYYRIRSEEQDGKPGYSSIVKVAMDGIKKIPSITVYPNPVTGNTISMQFNNIGKGNYFLQLFNAAGQQVAVKVIQHNNAASVESFEIKEKFAAGKYELKLLGEGINLITPVIKR